MIEINGHIKNYAKRRGFDINTNEMDEEIFVDLYETGQLYDPMIAFKFSPKGLHLIGFCYNQHLKNGFPVLIKDNDELKQVLTDLQQKLK